MSDHVVARISRNGRNGVITMALKSIWPPFPCGPAAQVDSAVRNCIRSVMRLFVHSLTLAQASLLVQLRLTHNVRSRLALHSRGTLRLQKASGRGCYNRRRRTRVRVERCEIGTLGLSARRASPSSTCGGLPLHYAEFPCPPPPVFGSSPFI